MATPENITEASSAPTSQSLILPRTHEDDVMRLVTDTGLDATEFMGTVWPSLDTPSDLLISALIHTPTDSAFRFDFDPQYSV